MRIGICVFGNILANDGRMVRELRIAELIRENNEVTLISWTRSKHMGTTGWVVRVPLRIIQALWWNLKLSYIVLTKKFDIVYCSND